jgi:hypothetical protein
VARNLWLLAGGLLLLAVTLAAGPDHFVAAVGRAYVRGLPQFSPVFREDLVRETRILYWILVALGATAVADYAILARRGEDLAARLAGIEWSEPGAWRGALLLAVVGYSVLFVSIRVVREAERAQRLASFSYEERRLRVWGVHTAEPDYRPALAFRAASGGRGTLAILHSGPRQGAYDVFYAMSLFPIRVYSYPSSRCSDAEVEKLRKASFDWVQLSCSAEAPFRPLALREQR